MTDRCDILACSIADQNEDHDYDKLYFSDANEDARIVTSSLSGRRNSGGFFSICEQYQATDDDSTSNVFE